MRVVEKDSQLPFVVVVSVLGGSVRDELWGCGYISDVL